MDSTMILVSLLTSKKKHPWLPQKVSQCAYVCIFWRNLVLLLAILIIWPLLIFIDPSGQRVSTLSIGFFVCFWCFLFSTFWHTSHGTKPSFRICGIFRWRRTILRACSWPRECHRMSYRPFFERKIEQWRRITVCFHTFASNFPAKEPYHYTGSW